MARSRPREVNQELIDSCEFKTMMRKNDPRTSKEAAAKIVPHLSDLHNQVIDCFLLYGSMTDEELENLPHFKDYGPSTVRKRRGELFRAKLLKEVGVKKNKRGQSMIIWNVNKDG